MNDFIVELAIRSLILAGLGLGIRFALIRSSAQARAKVLAVTMMALAILPLAMFVAPKLSVTVNRVQEIESSSVAILSPTASAGQPLQWGWLLIAAAGLLATRVIYSLVRFHKVEMGLTPASQSLSERVRSLTRKARTVFFCPEGEPPMTWGLVRPKIALPAESETWIEPQFRSVVLHEEAHIRRNDWAVSVAFRFVTAIYWFNPLVWALQALFEQDSERAADDCVLAEGLDAPEYAERILAVAQALQPRSGRLPAVTMARTKRLKGRLRAILSSKTPRGPMLGWKRTAILGPLVCGAFAAGIVVPVTERIPAIRHANHPLVADAQAPEPINSNLGDFDVSQPPATPPDTQAKSETPVNPPHVQPSNAQPVDMDLKVGSSVKTENNQKPDLRINDGKGHTITISNDDEEANDGDMNGVAANIAESVDKACRDASEETKKALADAQKEIKHQLEEARKEIQKSGVSGHEKEIAEASLNFGKDIATMSIKMAAGFTKGLTPNIDLDKKPAKDKKLGKKPDEKGK